MAYSLKSVAAGMATKLTKKTGTQHIVVTMDDGFEVHPITSMVMSKAEETALIDAIMADPVSAVPELPKGMVRIGMRCTGQSPAYWDVTLKGEPHWIWKESVRDAVLADGFLEFTCSKRYAARKGLPA